MRYFIGFLAIVALVVLVFVLVIRGFGGPDTQVETKLTDYAQTETKIRLLIEGPVNADQDHRAVRITVGRASNTIDVIQGYEGHVIHTQQYDSNESAYGTFLRALQLQGYLKGDTDPEKADSRGVCPTGRVYTFETVTGSDTVQRFWKTSCGSGTFKGNDSVIRQLFRAQIPDYPTDTRGTGL